MARLFYILFFVTSRLSLISLAGEAKRSNDRCTSFVCGEFGSIGFPFSNGTHPECGLLVVENCGESAERVKTIRLGTSGPKFYITSISQDETIQLHNLSVQIDHHHVTFDNHSCKSFEKFLQNLTLPVTSFLSFEFPFPQVAWKCQSNQSIPTDLTLACNDSKSSIFYYKHTNNLLPNSKPQCPLIPFQVLNKSQSVEFLNLFTGWFYLRVHVRRECRWCHHRGGKCQSDSKGNFLCAGATRGNRKLRWRLGLGLGIAIAGSTILIVLCILIILRRKKRKHGSSSFNSEYDSANPSSKPELEVGSAYYGVHIFSYSELAEATDNFSYEKELGDGGFGTVYYAKLRDGREVAVKRLYEHNYKRVEHFMNEVEILTRLRHRNLVTLYGCTSRHSQQGLLLVYEYIPNGTVADHLHGDCTKRGSLTWPIRMKIAIETASALAYLHACEIIHRDVKTNNILLDKNFCVKVADFGISRLFPTNVTHISTAPQGSPGYVDPEYHRCYQLTDKSDVYSFGVVLIELISSMPAVDISRHKDEINLANLALIRIQKCAIDELIDPCLGYQTDEEVKRMTTSVAELAFLCLQQNKEMRPSMEAVLEELKRIESGEILKWKNMKEGNDDNEALGSLQPPGSPPDCDESALLKPLRVPSSPISVTAKWVSSNTTPNVSS